MSKISLVELLRHDIRPKDHARFEDVVDGAARPRLVDDGGEVEVAPVERDPPDVGLVGEEERGVALGGPAPRAVARVVEVALQAGALEPAGPVDAALRARPRDQALVDV